MDLVNLWHLQVEEHHQGDSKLLPLTKFWMSHMVNRHRIRLILDVDYPYNV